MKIFNSLFITRVILFDYPRVLSRWLLKLPSTVNSKTYPQGSKVNFQIFAACFIDTSKGNVSNCFARVKIGFLKCKYC